MLIDVIDVNSTKIDKFEINEIKKTDNLGNSLYLVRNLQNLRKSRKTANTKTRSEVSGGGRKPFRQKGTGNARRGTSRSPLIPGGAIVFGPKPVKRKMFLNKDFVRNSFVSALNEKVDLIKIVKCSEIDLNAVKKMVGNEDKKVLLITKLSNDKLIKSFRNLRRVVINDYRKIEINDLVTAEQIYIADEVKNILVEGLVNV